MLGSHSLKSLRLIWRDALTAVILAIIIAAISYSAGQFTHPAQCGNDLWFDGDCNRHFSYMTDWYGDHSRTLRHPFYVPIIFTSVAIIRLLIPDSTIAVQIFMASVAAIWLVVLFSLLRVMGCQRLDAILLSLLASCSAAALFWFSVPESWGLGSLTILVSFLVVAIAQRVPLSPLWYILVSAATLGITVTNWVVGIGATLCQYPWKRSAQITLAAFLLVMLPWAIDKSIKYHLNSAAFVASPSIEATEYLLSHDSGGPLMVAQSFLFSTIVLPAIRLSYSATNPSGIDLRPVAGCMSQGSWPLLMTQSSPVGSGSLWGWLATLCWIALFSLGVWSCFSTKTLLKLRILLAITFFTQLGLHILFGYETFLYSLHFLPLLILILAFSTLTSARPLVRLLTVALIITASINNVTQFQQAVSFLQGIQTTSGL